MKKNFTTLLLLGVCLAGLPATGVLQAQTTRTLDLPRMQRDVEIMEMVLDRLMNRQAGRFMRLGTVSARGSYVPNFGVLFQIPNNTPFFTVYEYSQSHPRSSKTIGEKRVSGKGANATESGRMVVREGAAAELDEELLEFFSRYADAIGQLSDDDRIAVYSEGGSEFSVFFELSGEEPSQITSESNNFFAWTRKGDLAALRAGKLSESEFRDRLRFVRPQEHDSDIEIMSGIWDKITAARNGTAHGLYLEDYGAIFFTEADLVRDSGYPLWKERKRVAETAPEPVRAEAYRQIEEALREARSVDAAREKSWQEEYKKFKTKIAETFADYGHTLRNVKPDDWIVVTTDFHYAPVSQPQSLVGQIKKQQIDLYSSGKISREQLLKSVSYFEN